MTRRCRIGWLASVLVLAGLPSPGVGFGAAPTFERITVDDTYVDEQLSEACGVTATVTLQGQITLRTFPDGGTGLCNAAPSCSQPLLVQCDRGTGFLGLAR